MNLPHYPTPMIGRQREIGELDRALTTSRIVTVVGAGGIGKTRLAVELAARAGAQYDDGAYFVELEQHVDPDLVPQTIATALGVELRDGADPVTSIVNRVQAHSLLLVLDNCDGVLRGVERFADTVLERAPHVRILATSREPLRCVGELLYRLDTLDDDSSVRLFLDRALQANDAFVPTEADVSVIAQICRRLDGIPLAIELAAARIAWSTPKALFARLSERLAWRAEAGERPARRHHETLRSLIDWSYDLLDSRERTVFARLGVFSGEFSLDAAAYVIGEGIELRNLAEKSLIVPASGEERYRMLESIREYALLRLRESGDEERVRREHASFFAGLAAQLSSEFGKYREREWLARYEPDLDNFRAALTWAQTREKGLAASMLGNLKEFWFHVNLISEGLSRSQVMLAWLPLDDDRALGPLLAVATLAWRAGETRTSLDAATRALSIATRLGDAPAIAFARYSIGWALFKSGDTERAVRELHGAVSAYHALNDSFRSVLAEIDYAIALKRTDPERGRALLKQALPSARSSGWPRLIMRIETALAEYAFLDGSVGLAIELGREILATARAGRSTYALTVALVNLNAYLSVAGDADEAREIGLEAIACGRSFGMRIAVEWALQALAIGSAERGEFRAAAKILGHVDAFVDEVGAEREPTEAAVRERLHELLSESLEQDALEGEIAAGRALTLDEACALAADSTQT